MDVEEPSRKKAKVDNKFTRTQKPELLTDEQVQQFIVNGFLYLGPVEGVDHDLIYRKILAGAKPGGPEPNPGNNISARVPELSHVLNSPKVVGAMQSLLGRNFQLYPHKFPHVLMPKTTGIGNSAFTVETADGLCHQDSFSPLEEFRHDRPRWIHISYYPQDTPLEMGPTVVVPGTQYQPALTRQDAQRTQSVVGERGSVFLWHFNLGHAGGAHKADIPRIMVKTLFCRMEEPAVPSWDHKSPEWKISGSDYQGAPYLPDTWKSMWAWMMGKHGSIPMTPSPQPVKELLAQMDAQLEQNVELGPDRFTVAREAITKLGAMGPSVVPALLDYIRLHAGRPQVLDALRHRGLIKAREALSHAQMQNHFEITAKYEADLRLKEESTRTSWFQGQSKRVHPEWAVKALVEIGPAAIRPVLAAMQEPWCQSDAWARLNFAYFLGEVETPADLADQSADALEACLEDNDEIVAQTAAVAAGALAQRVPQAQRVQLVQALDNAAQAALDNTGDRMRVWNAWPSGRGFCKKWTPKDMFLICVVLALCRLSPGNVGAPDHPNLLATLVGLLHYESCGYISQIAAEALSRSGSPQALREVLGYYQACCWDGSMDIGADRTY